MVFTARRSYASAVSGVVILSVCHTRALWLIQRTYCDDIFIPHERSNVIFRTVVQCRLQQLTRFQLTSGIAWSLCDSWATYNADQRGPCLYPVYFEGWKSWPHRSANCHSDGFRICSSTKLNVTVSRVSRRIQYSRIGIETALLCCVWRRKMATLFSRCMTLKLMPLCLTLESEWVTVG